MEKINEVFFGEHGITSTSANHLANLAKELIAANDAKLKNLSFVTTKIDIVGSQSQQGKTVTQGVNEAFIQEIKKLLERISEYNAFCAWMREAIKAKEVELDRICSMTFTQWLRDNKIDIKSPDLEVYVDFSDIFEKLNIKERTEYYTLEAIASTIGRYIHKKGSISLARAQLQESIIKPYCATGAGKDTLIYSHCPSVDEAKVDEVFIDLQKWHRSVEQQLNQIRYSIKRKVTEEKIRLGNEKRLEREKFENQKKELMFQFNEWKVRENEKVSKLKIVIPEALQKTYDYLTSLEN